MTFRENTNATRATRLGFTLVELLVVITIIGILAGLALVALSGVPGAVQDTAVKMELTQIGQALDLYKQNRGSYPPDAAHSFRRSGDMTRHLNVVFGQRIANDYPAFHADTITDLKAAGYLSPNATTALTTFDRLDPSETYVLFLMGFSPDVERPLTGKGERTPLFEFDETRLIDPDGDGWWSYKPKYNDSEIVYFSAKTYDAKDSSGNTFVAELDCNNADRVADGVARPYGRLNANGAFAWVADNTFQLMVAGRDGHFGNDYTTSTSVKLYPSGIADSSLTNSVAYTLEDLDNITNFVEGSTLEADEDLE